MKILQLGPFPPPHGGVQSNIVAIRNYLAKRGVASGVVNLTRFKQPERDELYFPPSPLKTLPLLARLPYRLLHLHIGGHYPARMMALSLYCCSLPGRRTVLTFHSGGFPRTPEGQRANRWSALGFTLRRFDHVIAVNKEIEEMMIRFGVKPERVSTIRPDSFDPSAISPELPEKLRGFFAAHNPVLLSVGLLEPEYDLPLQIEAMADIRKRLPDAGLVMIGSGSKEAELRERIARNPEREHILLAGDVAHGDTLAAIERCAMLLRTTWYDGDAVSVREALWLGTPVIATDNGMRPAGPRLIPKENPEALKQAIFEVAGASGGREKRERQGYDHGLAEVYAVYEKLSR